MSIWQLVVWVKVRRRIWVVDRNWESSAHKSMVVKVVGENETPWGENIRIKP